MTMDKETKLEVLSNIAVAFAQKENSTPSEIVSLVGSLKQELGLTGTEISQATSAQVITPEPAQKTVQEPAPVAAAPVATPVPAPAVAPKEPAEPAAEAPRRRGRPPKPPVAPEVTPEMTAKKAALRDTSNPAVPIAQSFTEDKVFCLECGKGMSMLKRHLKAAHGLTTDEYRHRWSLPEEHPLTAPNYSQQKSAFAKRSGLGKNPAEEAENT